MMRPRRERLPSRALVQPRRLQITQTQIMKTATTRVTGVALPIKTLIGLVGGLRPPHDTTDDASFHHYKQGNHYLPAVGNASTGGV